MAAYTVFWTDRANGEEHATAVSTDPGERLDPQLCAENIALHVFAAPTPLRVRITDIDSEEQ
jgi:hypothetical protein